MVLNEFHLNKSLTNLLGGQSSEDAKFVRNLIHNCKLLIPIQIIEYFDLEKCCHLQALTLFSARLSILKG